MSNSTLKIKTKSLPNSRLAVELEIPAEQCKNSFQEALSNLSKSANLPGFRKGKVPKAVVLQQIGTKRIQASALEKLLETAWKEAIKEKSIKPLCEPELIGGFETLLDTFNSDSALTLTLETDIPPTPKLKTTKGLEVESEKVLFDPNKIDELIEQSRKQLATLIPIEGRAAKKGDVAVISFEGTFKDDNSKIEGGNSDSMDVELEQGQMIPGFVEGIIGMQTGDTKIVECTFPKDYPQENAQGRKASFSIHLKDLKAKELPVLDDSFAKQTSDKANMQELRNDLEKRLQEDVEQRNIKNRHESLLNALVKELEVEIPETLINQEVRNLIEQTARNFSEQGLDVKSTFTPELVKKLMDSSKPEAMENLRKQFALNALAKEEKIDVEEKEIDEKFTEIKDQFAKEKNIDLKRLREAIEDDLLKEKIFDWLEENNTVLEKSPKQKSTAKKSSTKSKTNSEKQKKTEKPTNS